MTSVKQSDTKRKKRSKEKKKKLITGESDKGKKKQSDEKKKKKKQKLIIGESDKGKKKQSDKGKKKSWKMKMCEEEEKKRSDVEMIEEEKPPRWDWDFFDPSGRGSGPPAAQKRSWPELVGLTGEEAKAKIEEEMPGDWVHVVRPRTFVTDDFRLDRVRIFIDSDGKVVRAPEVG